MGFLEYVVGFVVFIALYAAFVWRQARRKLTALRKLIRKHLKTLVLKRARGLARDDYGTIVDSGWSKEIAYFYDNVVPAHLRTDHDLPDVAALIEHEIGRLPARTLEQWTMADRNDIASGEDFEFHIAEELEDFGWIVRRTGRSGDQGADLVAEKGGVSVAVQCKLYSQPVGNKAVQEAIAAQRFYATDFAAVVSNAAFTKAATRLAQSADVLLVHTSDVDKLDHLADGEAVMAPTDEWSRSP
jgi:restriction system protein